MISTYKVGDFIVIKSGEIEKQFQIVGCETSHIRIIDTFTQIESKRKVVELDDLIVSGVATIKQQDSSERKIHQVDAIDFSSYSELKKLKAREKHEFVIGIIDHGLPSTSMARIDPVIDEIYTKGVFKTIKTRPSARSVQRWISRYKAANNSIRGLISLDDRKGNYDSKIENDVESYIELAIEHFKKPEKPTISCSYDHLQTLINYDNSFIKQFSKKRKVPSLTAFIKRLEKKAPKELMLAREGKEATNKAFKETKLPQEITLILQRVEADHTQLDLFIVDEKSNLILGRPYITSILDYKSKSLLGFYIGFENPSYLSIARALRHVILPKTYVKEMYPEIINEWQCYGFPKILVVDRGMDFESIALTDACLDLNIRIQRNPGKHPWYKGSIERFFRSLNDDLLNDKK
jgi:putative transposase